MGDAFLYHMIYPTRILSKIIAAINVVGIGGYLMVHDAVVLARCIWFVIVIIAETTFQQRVGGGGGDGGGGGGGGGGNISV
nr:hypothetical protein [Tanacetum cinerariifolium]